MPLLVGGWLMMSLLSGQPQRIRAQSTEGTRWSDPVPLSAPDSQSWFPDIVVDPTGRIHVAYDGNQPVSQSISEDGSVPAIMYTFFQDGEWREPNDLHLGGRGNIFRIALAVDSLGNLHMVCKRGGAGSELDYRQASIDSAYPTQAWSRHVLDKGVIYMSDIAIDSDNVIHVVYDKWVLLEEPLITAREQKITRLSEIFYRRSTDGGHTWSIPVNLSQTPQVGSYREQLKIDKDDVIHVSWDKGFDRWALYDEPRESVYITSDDGGMSWSEPTVITEPARTNAQTSVASDNRGNVLLVWRATNIDNLFYTWSVDDEETWMPPEVIPGLYARSYNETPFDAYEMATDSDDNIHLVAVGRTRLPESRTEKVPLGVYHLVWNGDEWSGSDPIATYKEEDGTPEYPKITISEGNLLHVTWFVRDQLFGSGEYYRIFYSNKRTEAIQQTPIPIPTATATPIPTATPLPPPTATPFPTIVAETSHAPQGLYTENDEVGRLAVALSPLAVLVLIVTVARLKWKR